MRVTKDMKREAVKAVLAKMFEEKESIQKAAECKLAEDTYDMVTKGSGLLPAILTRLGKQFQCSDRAYFTFKLVGERRVPNSGPFVFSFSGEHYARVMAVEKARNELDRSKAGALRVVSNAIKSAGTRAACVKRVAELDEFLPTEVASVPAVVALDLGSLL